MHGFIRYCAALEWLIGKTRTISIGLVWCLGRYRWFYPVIFLHKKHAIHWIDLPLQLALSPAQEAEIVTVRSHQKRQNGPHAPNWMLKLLPRSVCPKQSGHLLIICHFNAREARKIQLMCGPWLDPPGAAAAAGGLRSPRSAGQAAYFSIDLQCKPETQDTSNVFTVNASEGWRKEQAIKSL